MLVMTLNVSGVFNKQRFKKKERKNLTWFISKLTFFEIARKIFLEL